MGIRAREQARRERVISTYPPQLLVGVVLIAIAWPLAWIGPKPFSEHTFFPLWLGYILTVDGLTQRRTGTSLLTRSGSRFAMLFAFSIPLWWLFEFANEFLRNWRYVPSRQHGTLAYVALASLAFTTVMPAIFVTGEFYRSFAFLARPIRWVRIAPSRAGLIAIAAFGLAMFVASLMFPDDAFPLVWIGLFLFMDVINAFTGGRSITAQVTQGRWDTVLVLFAAGITCGIFWEMWNYWSLPKWVYDVPVVPRPKLFEMPLLGYGGYLPFALEVYAFYHLTHTLAFRRRDTFLRFDEGGTPEHHHA
jgi:hypothetical protein